MSETTSPWRRLSVIGPGMLVAATGVGAGDLATAALTGSRLGVAVLWVVVVGAFLKFVLNEGLARWQLATGTTLLEGAMLHLGRTAQYTFLAYFLVWSFMVAAALMSACGVTAQAILPIHRDTSTGKIVYGILLSLVGLLLVRMGGYRLFEKVMSLCIGLMFLTVSATALLLIESWSDVLSGMAFPSIPQLYDGGLAWTIALMGGVGGTVTVLCYGYWIREEDRFGAADLSLCRLDLAVGYTMTALFGLAMVVIGSSIEVEGRGVGLVVKLSERLVEEVGIFGSWAFLLGTFGAVFSSLLGVWQSVPYLFSDLVGMMRSGSPPREDADLTGSLSYRAYLYALATVPIIGLWIGFATMQRLYAVIGALFIPLLALVLLLLNTRSEWVGEPHRNRPLTSALLVLILVFFLWLGSLTALNALTR